MISPIPQVETYLYKGLHKDYKRLLHSSPNKKQETDKQKNRKKENKTGQSPGIHTQRNREINYATVGYSHDENRTRMC